jgi:hypothetical protein
VKVTWLWSELYKGLEVTIGNPIRWHTFIGWTHREWKRRGW